MGNYYKKVLPIVDKNRWLITGVSALDLVCGRGIPRGSFLQLYGREGSRKTTAALVMLRAAQRAGWVTVYYNIEGGLLEEVAFRLGIDNMEPTYVLKDKPGEEIEDPGDNIFGTALGKKVNITSPGYIYVAGWETSTVEDMFAHAERVTKACVRGGFTPLFVADAMSSLASELQERKGYHGDAHMDLPRRTRQGYNMFQKPLAKCGGIFVAIDHKMPSKQTAGSGSAPAYFASTRLDFSVVKEEGNENDPDGRAQWFEAEIVAEKSRHAASGRSRFAFSYKPTEYDEDGDVLRRYGPDIRRDLEWCGERIGIYERRGSWTCLPENFPEGEVKLQAGDAWDQLYQNHVRKHPEWVEAMVDRYHLQRWYEFCADAGKDAHEEVRRYGEDTYSRFVENEKHVAEVTGLESFNKRRRRSRTLTDEMAEVESRAAEAKPKAKSKGKGTGTAKGKARGKKTASKGTKRKGASTDG